MKHNRLILAVVLFFAVGVLHAHAADRPLQLCVSSKGTITAQTRCKKNQSVLTTQNLGAFGIVGSPGPKGDKGDTGPQGVPGESLALYDSTGKKVGPVVPSVPCTTATVVEVDSYRYLLCVSGTTLMDRRGIPNPISDPKLFFESPDCSGTPYFLNTVSNHGNRGGVDHDKRGVW
jgi:hypothetical protein